MFHRRNHAFCGFLQQTLRVRIFMFIELYIYVLFRKRRAEKTTFKGLTLTLLNDTRAFDLYVQKLTCG
jgi:hypothetical protein